MCVPSHSSHVQLFATLWTVCSPPGSSVYGILQARILEWVAMPSSKGSSLLFLINKLIYFTLQYCIGFAIGLT